MLVYRTTIRVGLVLGFSAGVSTSLMINQVMGIAVTVSCLLAYLYIIWEVLKEPVVKMVRFAIYQAILFQLLNLMVLVQGYMSQIYEWEMLMFHPTSYGGIVLGVISIIMLFYSLHLLTLNELQERIKELESHSLLHPISPTPVES